MRRRRAPQVKPEWPATGRPGPWALIIAILATASLAGGLLYLIDLSNFAAHYQTTTGTVTAVSKFPFECLDVCTAASYDITIQYTQADGRPVTFIARDNNRSLPIGRHVRVYYLPAATGVGYTSLDTPLLKQREGIFFVAVGLLGLFLVSLRVITTPPVLEG